MRRHHSRLKRAALAITFVAAAIGGGMLFGSAALSQDQPPPPDPAARQMITEMPRDVAQSFGLLRRSATARDALPPSMRDVGQSGEPTVSGINPALARRAITTPDGGAVYLAPGADRTCVVTTRADMPMGMGCANNPRVLEQGMWFSQAMSRTAVGRRVEGVVPDGVATVRITRVDQDPIDGAVSSNGFSVDVPGQPKELIWLGEDGSVIQTQLVE